MVLKALIDYYEILKGKGAVARQGWAEVKLSYALQISPEGELCGCEDLTQMVQKGQKRYRVGRQMIMPAPAKRSGASFCPNFLYDNSAYVLGIDTKGDPERARTCFREAGRFYRRLLTSIDLPEAHALLRYYETWDPYQAGEHPYLKECIRDILKGANITFMVGGQYLHEIPALQDVWDAAYADDADLKWMVDLVVNEEAPIAPIHPGIRGVAGAQPSGAALVSFNEPSACSYGKAKGYNAPISRENAFAYTAALNYLASDWEHQYRIGMLTLYHWPADGEESYQDFINAFLFGRDSEYSCSELLNMAEQIVSGVRIQAFGHWLSHDMPYTFLLISSNAARLSVQVFEQDSFGNFLCSMLAWSKAMAIDEYAHFSFYQILMAGAKEHSKETAENAVVVSQTLRAILTGQAVPAVLYNNVQMCISSRRDITPGQAAVIKAYHTMKPSQVSRGSLTERLNPENKRPAYLLGRLFAVLERVQYRVKPGHSPLRQRYLHGAVRIPATVFPEMLQAAERHLQSMGQIGDYIRRDMQELSETFSSGYPDRLTPDEKAEFQLGYYHQRSENYSAARAYTGEVAARV